MGVALLASKRSKDPSTQVGAIIVSTDNRIVATGWNGMPKSQSKFDNDVLLPWGKDSSCNLENKYMYVVHAEPNAIFHASESVRGCTMYITWFPCSECAKAIIQAGISKIVYLNEHTTDRYRESMEAAKIMFKLAEVVCEKYAQKKVSIRIEFR